MKNFLVPLFLLLFLNSFSIKPPQYEYTTSQITGYVIIQGKFQEVLLKFIGIDGKYHLDTWELVKYPYTPNMPTKGPGANKRSVALNPQHEYAINYNFTHYVEIMYYGYAYFNPNQ